LHHDKIQIKDENYQLIIEHKRLYGAEKESMNWLPYLDLIQKRPRALKHIDFFNTLPENWRQIFNKSDLHEQRKYMKILSTILLESTLDFAEQVLDETMKYGVWDVDSIQATYDRLNNDYSIVKYEPENAPFLPEYDPELAVYNDLIRSI